MKRITASWRGFSGLAMASVLPLLLPSPSAYAHFDNGAFFDITEAHLDIGSTKLARAFVKTGSDSPVVFCQINENEPGYGALRLAGLLVLCRARQIENPDISGEYFDGVGIAIIFPVLFDTRGGFRIQVSVHQVAAEEYVGLFDCPDC